MKAYKSDNELKLDNSVNNCPISPDTPLFAKSLRMVNKKTKIQSTPRKIEKKTSTRVSYIFVINPISQNIPDQYFDSQIFSIGMGPSHFQPGGGLDKSLATLQRV